MRNKTLKSKKTRRRISIEESWPTINPCAAGVDIGAKEHWVCVPAGAASDNVRKFGPFTADLNALADWLQACGVSSVAMEATGVYWIPLFQILEARGLEVLLVNPRQTKNVAGRKTDCQDCQWIQRLHTYGLLQGSFRPADPYCVLRTFLRYRDELTCARCTQAQHMQKALQQMNVQLRRVFSDVAGVSGLAVIKAILEGERDPAALSKLADRRIRATRAMIEKALVGDYRREHLFVLRQAFELFHNYQEKIAACDQEIIAELARLPDKVDPALKPLPPRLKGKVAQRDQLLEVDMREPLYRKFGVDLTAVEGIGVATSLVILTEIGADLRCFKTEKHFCSYLGLCPDNRISGGKVLSTRTRRVVHRVSDALRIAATTLERSQTALGSYYRRMKTRLGAAEAVTAMAHKLARLVYRLIKFGENYVRQGMEDYEKKFQERKLSTLQKTAKKMGFSLVANQQVSCPVS
jgi:transposase